MTNRKKPVAYKKANKTFTLINGRMNHLRNIIFFFIVINLVACSDQGNDSETPEQEPESLVYTDYNEQTELFVEFSALIVGQPSSFAAHFSRMSDFLPVESGVVTVTLSGGSFPIEQFTIESAAVPGIFIPVAEPKYAGQRQLSIALKSNTQNVKHDLGVVTVYPDLDTALAAVSEEEEESGEISFLKEQQWKVEFATEVIKEHELQNSVRSLGTIKAAAGHKSYVSAPINGHLLTRASDLPQVGMRVKKGQILAVLSARLSGVSDIAELQLNVQKARAQKALADNDLKRIQTLFEAQLIAKRRVTTAQSKAQVAKVELNAAEKRLKQTLKQEVGNASGVNIYAPISGVLAVVNIASGSYVTEGQALFYIINPKTLWLDTHVAEADIAQLQTPERVDFKVNGFNDHFQINLDESGKLVSRGLVIDQISRMLHVTFEFNNENLKLPAGLMAQARIYSGKKIRSIAVPESALIDDNGLDVVFVHSSGESFQRRVLRLGLKDQGYVQVLSGLAAGERVVTTGAYLIHLASSSPAQAGGHGHAH